MRCLAQLWQDESGAVLSSELVLVGTLGVVGATVGLDAVSDAVNLEFVDFAHAMRSLDQSYEVRGVTGRGAWTAGSAFRQQPVEESLAELDAAILQNLEAARELEEHRGHDRRDFESREEPGQKNPRMEEGRDSKLTPPESPTPRKKVVPPKKKPKSTKGDEEVTL